jgi:hypothetical protein
MKRVSLLITAIILLASCSPKGFEWTVGTFRLRLSTKGYLTEMTNTLNHRNYLYGDTAAPLLQIRKDGRFIQPVSCKVEDDGKSIIVGFPGYEAHLSVEARQAYLVLKLDQVTGADTVDLVTWGPYPTTIGETVGETVGVVRDSTFAIGIQALNLKTLGGWPSQESDIEPSYDLFETNSLVDIADSVKVFYRGQTARKQPYGSSIQAYCRNRNQERIIPNWGHDYYVAPAFDDGGVTGSSIALFGCDPSKVLATIGDLEVTEGLPHPMIDGEWGKISKGATAPYLIMSFGVDNFEDALELTKKAGLRYLYHEGPFETWGHFKLNHKQFPENWETMKLMVKRAAEEGILLGVHTLSNFITTNDPYVTPVPDPRLARVGSSVLTRSIGPSDRTIGIADPKFFNQMKNNTLHAVMIGNELVTYKQVTTAEPWELTDCVRGAYGTKASPHEAGDMIGKLMDHGYRTFLTDNSLAMEVSDRLADFFNFTGCRQISFDGLEGNWSTGMGQYGRQRFTQNWYDHLDPELKGKVITDASNPGHFFWHMFTRMNWGEPWYAGFRESQTQYRLLNQLYFRRNYIPAMLGWFRMTPETSIEDIEWLLARSGGFNAGYALVTSLDAVKRNGESDRILAAIREWDKARMAGAFTEDIRKKMTDIRNEYHLDPYGADAWNLVPFTIWRSELKPGTEEVALDIRNENPDQPVQFILSSGAEGAATGITLTIDGKTAISIKLDLPANHYIKYSGGSYATLYDQFWHPVKTAQLIQNEVTLTQGDHKVKIGAVLKPDAKAGMKIEMKTAGLPYQLTTPKN